MLLKRLDSPGTEVMSLPSSNALAMAGTFLVDDIHVLTSHLSFGTKVLTGCGSTLVQSVSELILLTPSRLRRTYSRA